MPRLPFARLCLLAALSLLSLPLLSLAPAAQPAVAARDTVYALTSTGFLARFLAISPGTFDLFVPVTGLVQGDTLVAIDFRPATGQLYAVSLSGAGSNGHGRLYTLNPATGVAALVSATPFATTLSTSAGYGMDFNPVSDRIRLVNTAGVNLRLNPTTGGLSGADTNINCATPPCQLVALAYDRNQRGAAATTAYGLDWFNAKLVMLGGLNGSTSPNTGTVTNVGNLGLGVASTLSGFDIAPSGLAYASIEPGVDFRFYTINLANGAASLVGKISSGAIPIVDIAVPSRFFTLLPLTRK